MRNGHWAALWLVLATLKTTIASPYIGSLHGLLLSSIWKHPTVFVSSPGFIWISPTFLAAASNLWAILRAFFNVNPDSASNQRWTVSSFIPHTRWLQSISSSVLPNLHHCTNARNSDKYVATVSPWRQNRIWNRYRCTISEGGGLWCCVITATRYECPLPQLLWCSTTAYRHSAHLLPDKNISLSVGIRDPVSSLKVFQTFIVCASLYELSNVSKERCHILRG